MAGLTLANQPVGFTEIESLVQQIEAANVDLFESAFEAVVEDLNDLEGSLDRLVALFQKWLGSISIDDVKELLVPQVAASLDSIPVGIQFPRTILREVDEDGKPVPDPQHPGEDKPALVTFDLASLSYSTADGLEFNLADSLNVNFPRSEIFRSGLILELHDFKIDFSRTTNIPEAIADGPAGRLCRRVREGWDDNFSGFLEPGPQLIGRHQSAEPVDRNRRLLRHARAGSRHRRGILRRWSNSLSAISSASASTTFSITLKQNAIKESNIKGTLIIPGFKDARTAPPIIDIDVAIRQNGDFDITAKEKHGLVFQCGDVFDLTLKSAYFGQER